MSTRSTTFCTAIILGSFCMTSGVYGQSETLKAAYADDFLVGAALSEDQLLDKNSAALGLVERQFNSITPENILKWEHVHPSLDKYNFEAADKFVEFGEAHDMFMVGHTLVWHSQTPKWVFEDENGQPLTREALLERMRDHIHTVVGRYKGRIHAWDVVNEAIVTDRLDERIGKWRRSPWHEIIGPDYIDKAFQFAHEADPNAELYYNDYDEWKLGKRQYFKELVDRLKAQGLPIDGIGLQGHWGLEYPGVTETEFMFRDLSQLGVPLMITELDINVLPKPVGVQGADVGQSFRESPQFNPFPDELPEIMQTRLSDRYEIVFKIFHEYRDSISRVTFWGVDDGQSWRNYWPIRGRTNYPLLFDRSLQPKPAYDAVVRIAVEGK